MPARMPVLRQDNMFEAPGKPVDWRNDFAATRHGKKAAGAEIVLDVDDNNDIVGIDREVFRHGFLAAAPVPGLSVSRNRKR